MMQYAIKKKVHVTLKLTLNELAELEDMLRLLDREVLSKMPGDPKTAKQMTLIDEIRDILEEASR